MKNFIGRKNELEVLERIASEAGAGDANSIFLSGKRGIGKTKLLRQLCNHLFNSQDDAVPFFYSIKTAFVSIENFSSDYLAGFILQSLAFRKKDPMMIDSSVYSLEDLRELARNSGAHWAADIIDGFLKIVSDGDPMNIFLYAISAPNRSHQSTGMPVIVMVDDFHKIRKFCELNADEINTDFWMFYENAIQSLYTPHIFTGLEAELNEMFFEETSFGDYLEIMHLPGLDQRYSLKLFTLLCEAYGLKVETDSSGLVEVFAGNPFYMKNFLQAARQKSRTFSEDGLWLVYLDEVIKGKTYKYWTSLLKKYVPQFDLRKPSLRYLYYLCNNNADIFIEDPEELLSIDREKLEQIMKLLNISGTIESGFSEMKLAEDKMMTDVLKGLYHTEILGESGDEIKDIILGDKRRPAKMSGTPVFDVKIPAVRGAELVAVKSLEQIGGHYNVPLDITGQLQLALVELLTSAFSQNGSDGDSYHLKFMVKDRKFVIETIMAQPDFTLTEEDAGHIKAYLDDIQVESLMNGTKIVLIKEL